MTRPKQGDFSAALNRIAVPDLWQSDAIKALRDGEDVVVHAPTGAGKTLIFEHWSNQGKIRGQAIYTVPTRALANDKLAEWRSRGWNVGISTGDLSENLSANILVATLETQKARLIQGDGPDLLVIDEYQMLGDEDRGLNYELALAMAPPNTQLLLLSGSVGNPKHVVNWLKRLGRRVRLIEYHTRPVPLEETHINPRRDRGVKGIEGHWPQFITRALADDLGPVLLFAPQRKLAESLARELAHALPETVPLKLTEEQRKLAGHRVSRMLESRVCYHHSGLSYAVRAGLIEPLAKAGQLRVVVATMGLAAGINFSLRSVALAGDSYKRGGQEHPIAPDEILQMYGRAGRRGIDETGYALVSSRGARLSDGFPAFLSRSGLVDWGALLSVMKAAADGGQEPFSAAVNVQKRLFTTKPIVLGVETALQTPETPCGLKTDAERARHIHKQTRQMLNSRDEWQAIPAYQEARLADIRLVKRSRSATLKLEPILTNAEALENFGSGRLARVADADDYVYGRCLRLAEKDGKNRYHLSKTLRRLIQWKGRIVSSERWENRVLPQIRKRLEQTDTRIVDLSERDDFVELTTDISNLRGRVPIDKHGVPLWRPPERRVTPPECQQCPEATTCQNLSGTTGVALLWRRLKLISPDGNPTTRGQLCSFFGQGQGLGIAAAIEDGSYPIDELVYDLANLDAGFRFSREEDRFEGRLAVACRKLYGFQNIQGYLEQGLPPGYGYGANEVVFGVHRDPASKNKWVTKASGPGDVDRIIIEWRSLLRRIAFAPKLEIQRWRELKQMATALLEETSSPTDTKLPPLSHAQTKRVSHRLQLRKRSH